MSKLIDLTGNKYGRLIVLHKDNERKTSSGSYWICQCDCGTIKSIKSSSLRRGEIQSCGCLRNERTYAGNEKNRDHLEGQRFGKLVVLRKDESIPKGKAVHWICQCDCGKVISVQGGNLKRKDVNRTISCGCYHRSIGAENILTILTDNNINFIDEYVFSDLPKSRFDFAILNNKNEVSRLIEFDGEQHFKDIPAWGGLELQQKRDRVKNEYALSHKIPLIRIPYWQRDNITLDMLLSDKYLVTDAKGCIYYEKDYD